MRRRLLITNSVLLAANAALWSLVYALRGRRDERLGVRGRLDQSESERSTMTGRTFAEHIKDYADTLTGALPSHITLEVLLGVTVSVVRKDPTLTEAETWHDRCHPENGRIVAWHPSCPLAACKQNLAGKTHYYGHAATNDEDCAHCQKEAAAAAVRG